MKFDNLTPEQLEKAANMLKAIAHPMRIAILECLEDGKKLTVTEIHEYLQIEQSTASHHLGILKDKGVLSSKREGKNVARWTRLYPYGTQSFSTPLSCSPWIYDQATSPLYSPD